MLPTPDTSHISSSTYPPAEDSYLFLDALATGTEVAYLSQRFLKCSTTPLVVEVGVGSGIVLAFLTANSQVILGRPDVLCLGTDLNVDACQAATLTIDKHCDRSRRADGTSAHASLGCINGDLAGCLKPAEVDILLFNPPYVPSDAVPMLDSATDEDAFERDSALLACATDGGVDGMEVTERLLKSLPDVLSRRGVTYVLLCRRNQPDEVAQRIRSWDSSGEWQVDRIKDSGKSGGIEKLCILRITRTIS